MEHGGIWEINLKQSTGTGIFTSMDGSFWRCMSVNSYYSPIECLETDLQNGPSKRKTSILEQRIDFHRQAGCCSFRVGSPFCSGGGNFFATLLFFMASEFLSWISTILNPCDKYACQIRSFPPIGAENKTCLTPPPRHPPNSSMLLPNNSEKHVFCSSIDKNSIRMRPSS